MHKLGVYVFSFLLIGFLSVESSIAATYEPGHQALQLWNEEAMKNVPQWLNIWLSIMVGAFALGLLFVWRHVAARWLVGGFILMVLFVFFITFKCGKTSVNSYSHLYKSLDCDNKKLDFTKDCFSRNIFPRETEWNQSRPARLTSNHKNKGQDVELVSTSPLAPI